MFIKKIKRFFSNIIEDIKFLRALKTIRKQYEIISHVAPNTNKSVIFNDPQTCTLRKETYVGLSVTDDKIYVITRDYTGVHLRNFDNIYGMTHIVLSSHNV